MLGAFLGRTLIRRPVSSMRPNLDRRRRQRRRLGEIERLKLALLVSLTRNAGEEQAHAASSSHQPAFIFRQCCKRRALDQRPRAGGS